MMEWISIKDRFPEMERIGLTHSSVVVVLTKNNDRLADGCLCKRNCEKAVFLEFLQW